VIFDCFTFFDELDLLELRLQVLGPVVDRFVICESPFTFRGTPKPLYFERARERFAPWRDKIVHLVYEGPASADPWDNEFSQRNYLIDGLRESKPDDLILIGDCDEIPDPRNVGQRPAAKRILAHRQRFSIGYVNRISPVVWIGTRAIARGDIEVYGSINTVRQHPDSETETIDGGWHLSSFGGAEVMQKKRAAYSHVEYGIPYYADRHRLQVELGSENEAHWVPLDESFPAPLHEDARWSAYIWPKPEPQKREHVLALQHAYGCLAYVPESAARVVAVTEDREHFTRAGEARFGERFGGILASMRDATALPGAWIVVDGLERENLERFRAVHDSGAGIVAYARNARSCMQMRAVLDGAGFPLGRASAVDELRAWFAANGERPDVEDRIESVDLSGFIWPRVPEMLYDLVVRDFRFPEISRQMLSNFLAHAFIFRFAPRAA
jgi:beta-1,4-mannosyl-glycoprotein beta-1,4-N-acetylglucosaminyltransferase